MIWRLSYPTYQHDWTVQERWDGHLAQINSVTYRVRLFLAEVRPIHVLLYHAGPRKQEDGKAEIDKRWAMKGIEPAQTESDSLIVLVPKNDGTLRFWVEYRRHNALATRDSYLSPWMDECIDSLGYTMKIFTFDANSGYWPIEVHIREHEKPAEHEKTEFTSHQGVHRLTRMHFELGYVPAKF